MEQLEVKTISERSHEDSLSMSLVSSKVNTPGGHHKSYLSSGGIQRRLQSELADINESMIHDTDQQLKQNLQESNKGGKQIQILDLLNEICEEAEENKGEEDQSKIEDAD